MKKTILLMLFATLSLQVKSEIAQTQQTNSEFREIKVGDYVPGIPLGKIFNINDPNLTFEDLKGKLVILDFWATWCSPCVRSLPKMDSLQKKFGDQIVIIAVDGIERGENLQKAKSLFKTRGLNLACVAEDTVLEKLFPHLTIPHEVWIDKDGKVIGITDEKEVTAENINNWIQFGKISFANKFENRKFNGKAPLFMQGNGEEGTEIFYRSILSGPIKGASGFFRPQYDSRKKNANGETLLTGFTTVNIDIFRLFYKAFDYKTVGSIVHPRFVRLKTKEGNEYLTNYFEENTTRTILCYTLQLPFAISDSLFYRKYLLEELNKSTMLTGEVKKERHEVWILTAYDTSKLTISNDPPDVVYTNSAFDALTEFKGMTISEVAQFLESNFVMAPRIINETNVKRKRYNIPFNDAYLLDMNNRKTINYEKWRLAFRNVGLNLTKDIREIEILQLEEKK